MVPTRALTITVTEGLYGRFVEMARKQGMTPAVYGKLLFEAAYSARCGMTGDRELDAAVAAIGVEQQASASAVADAETEHLRQRLAAALEAAEKWKAEAQEREKDWCDAAAERDIARCELQGLKSEHSTYVVEAHRVIGELQALGEDVGLEPGTPRIEGLRELFADLQAKLVEQQRVIAGLNAQLTEQFDLSTKMTARAVEAEQSVCALEARIAAATMTQISHPEPATLAEAGGGMEETVAAHRPKRFKAVSSAILALTPDQAKRARTYHGYGMSAADIAKAMKVDVAAVKAAFWRGA